MLARNHPAWWAAPHALMAGTGQHASQAQHTSVPLFDNKFLCMPAYKSPPALGPPACASSSCIAIIQTQPNLATIKPTMRCLGVHLQCSALRQAISAASPLIVLWESPPAAANTAHAQVPCRYPVSICNSSSMVHMPVMSPGSARLALCAARQALAQVLKDLPALYAGSVLTQRAYERSPCTRQQYMLHFCVNMYATPLIMYAAPLRRRRAGPQHRL